MKYYLLIMLCLIGCNYFGFAQINVGIGVQNPVRKLDVATDINFSGTLYKNKDLFKIALAVNDFTDGKTNSTSVHAGANAGVGSTGAGNTSVGISALFTNTTGYWNTAIGHLALFSNTTGVANTAIGRNALYTNTTGLDNTAIGYQAMYLNTTGQNNTATGSFALNSNNTGSWNVAVGRMALRNNTAGENNTAAGWQALNSNTLGNLNTAIGAQSLLANNTGNANTAVGYLALLANTSGQQNVAFGLSALQQNTTGLFNTAFGNQSLYNNKANRKSTAIGKQALFYTDDRTTGRDTYNTAIGYEALMGISPADEATGQYNTAVGDQVLYNNSEGFGNSAIGGQSLYSNIYGNKNTASGYKAMFTDYVGELNTAFGYESAYSNPVYWSFDGTFRRAHNTSLGSQSLREGADTSNSAIGFNALSNTRSGTFLTVMGSNAMTSSENGNSFVSIGASVIAENNTGSGNGWNAIGYNTRIYDFNRSVCIGYLALNTSDDQIRFGNASVLSIGGYQNWTNVSDIRFKNNINENVQGLPFIRLLRPVTYQLNQQAFQQFYASHYTGQLTTQHAAQIEIWPMIHTGFIAQEVEAAAISLNYDFSGVDKPKNNDDFYGLRYAAFTVPLVKAVQELEQQQKKLKHQNEALKIERENQKQALIDLHAKFNKLATQYLQE